MEESDVRITRPERPPNDSEIAQWMGERGFHYWSSIVHFIDHTYPKVFAPDWLFGGRKHGWSLRYKKGKSFCTLIPEKNRFALLIVFGAEERNKIELIKDFLSQETRSAYDSARTYHDGKWVLLDINSERILKDVGHMLAVKRKPAVREHM
jgi:hypothetical protein